MTPPALPAPSAVPLPGYPDLAGQVVVVTGGTGGLGAPLCRALAAQGARVAVGGRDPAAAAEIAAELTSTGAAAVAAPADAASEEQLAAMSEHVTATLGPPDAVACFAGGAVIGPAPTYLITPSQWASVIDANLTTTFLTVRALLPAMIAARRGAIVTVASAAGRIATGATAPYAVAKAGIVTLTQHLAREVAGHGVRVNCVSPSVVLTDRNRPDGAERDALIAQHPLGRLGNSQDVVAATLFLLSGASGWMTGITIDVAGGRVTV